MFKSSYTLALLIISVYFSWVRDQGSLPEKFTIKGSFINENPSPIIISFLNACHDTLVKNESVDEKGNSSFENIATAQPLEWAGMAINARFVEQKNFQTLTTKA